MSSGPRGGGGADSCQVLRGALCQSLRDLLRVPGAENHLLAIVCKGEVGPKELPWCPGYLKKLWGLDYLILRTLEIPEVGGGDPGEGDIRVLRGFES